MTPTQDINSSYTKYMHVTLTCPLPLFVSLHLGVCNQPHSLLRTIPTEELHLHGMLQQPYINKH